MYLKLEILEQMKNTFLLNKMFFNSFHRVHLKHWKPRSIFNLDNGLIMSNFAFSTHKSAEQKNVKIRNSICTSCKRELWIRAGWASIYKEKKVLMYFMTVDSHLMGQSLKGKNIWYTQSPMYNAPTKRVVHCLTPYKDLVVHYNIHKSMLSRIFCSAQDNYSHL